MKKEDLLLKEVDKHFIERLTLPPEVARVRECEDRLEYLQRYLRECQKNALPKEVLLNSDYSGTYLWANHIEMQNFGIIATEGFKIHLIDEMHSYIKTFHENYASYNEFEKKINNDLSVDDLIRQARNSLYEIVNTGDVYVTIDPINIHTKETTIVVVHKLYEVSSILIRKDWIGRRTYGDGSEYNLVQCFEKINFMQAQKLIDNGIVNITKRELK